MHTALINEKRLREDKISHRADRRFLWTIYFMLSVKLFLSVDGAFSRMKFLFYAAITSFFFLWMFVGHNFVWDLAAFLYTCNISLCDVTIIGILFHPHDGPRF